jgi:hypothetical protein
MVADHHGVVFDDLRAFCLIRSRKVRRARATYCCVVATTTAAPLRCLAAATRRRGNASRVRSNATRRRRRHSPVLGWTAVTGEVTTDALLLFRIIFSWLPPHFWSLALYRAEDYVRAGVPMLPVMHCRKCIQLQVLLYAVHLFGASLSPYVVSMSGLPYLVAALILGGFPGILAATLRRLQQ